MTQKAPFFIRPWSSIRAKLGIFTMILMAAISVSIVLFFPARLEQQSIGAITRRATTVADMTAYGLSSSVDLKSPDAVRTFLESSEQVEDLLYVFVTTTDWQLVSSINRDPQRYLFANEILRTGGLSSDGDIVRVHRAIIADGEPVGTLHIALSTTQLRRDVRRSQLMTAGASILIFLFGLAGVYAVSHVITRPLTEIVAAAEKISEGNFDGRVNIRTADEIGRLGSAFNSMVDGLRSAYQHLESANATLAYHSQDLQVEIAEKRKAEEALRASESKFRAVVEHATDVVAVLNTDGRIRYVSPASIHMMGVHPESLAGENAADFLHPRDRSRFQKAIEDGTNSKTKVIDVEARWRHANGTWRFLAFRGRNLNDLPGIEGQLFNVTDITESKHFQTELVLAKEKAEEMVVLKDSFLTNMSHEIRTPLTGILGFAQILRSEVGDEHMELVDHIQQSGTRLLNTLNSVLDLAELEALSERPELEPVDVCREVRETAHIIAPVAQLQGLHLYLETPDEPVFAQSNANCVQRAITNLASNAVKFTEKGSVTISVSEEKDLVIISVTDTGVGISPDFMPKLFGEFTQESTGNARSHEGSGLGLAITRRLIDLINGTIAVESVRGQGTRFVVTLPKAQAAPAEAREIAEIPRTVLKAVKLPGERRAS